MHSSMHHTLTTILELLLIASVVAAAVRYVRIPYSAALVLTGLVLGIYQLLPGVHLDPEIVMFIFLPALLFEGAIKSPVQHLRDNIRPIAILVLPGIILTTLITGTLIHGLLGLPWPLAFLFGAIIAPSDTISVLAILKELKLPERLNTIIEGENLFTDGTSIVLYRLIVAIILGQMAGPATLAGQFVLVFAGGVVVGAILGTLAVAVMTKLRDTLIELMVSTILAYGAYLLAEQLHVSGVVAVVAAGLVVGNAGDQRRLAPTTRVALHSFWEYAAFLVNSFVFLLIGLAVEFQALVAQAWGIGLALLAVFVGRILIIYPYGLISSRVDRPLPLAWQHLMVWGNVKGSLSIALAIGLPAEVPYRDVILTLIYGVVLASLVIQGMTLRAVAARMIPSVVPEHQHAYQKAQSALLSARGAQQELTRLFEGGLISRSAYDFLRARYQRLAARAQADMLARLERHPELESLELEAATRNILQFERGLLRAAVNEQVIEVAAGQELLEAIEDHLLDLERNDGIDDAPVIQQTARRLTTRLSEEG